MAKKVKQLKTPSQAKNLNHSSRATLTTFADHIKELRRRILWVALLFFVVSTVAYQFHDQLVALVMRPLNGQKLIYLTPGGGFSFIFQITLYAGLVVAAPMLVYQLYAFIRPALPSRARLSALKIVCFAVTLLLAGVGYGYFVAVPAALHFLATFAGAQVIPSLTAEAYLSFFLAYVAGLALLFQLPLLLLFWHWVKPIKPGGLLKSERFIILFAFVAAALITPTPDIINQALIAVPLIIIYQIGVVSVLVSIRRQHHRPRNTVNVVKNTTNIIEPTNKPSALVDCKNVVNATLSTKPVASLNNQKPMRMVDGFAGAAKHTNTTALQPARRPAVAVPARPATQQTLLQRRPMLRIDGMSPM